MSDASRRHAAILFPRMKRWRSFLLLTAVCGFVGYVVVSVALRRDMMIYRVNSSRTFHLDQDIHQKDSNFLDDLVRKQSEDEHHDGSYLSAPDQNIDRAGTIVSSSKAVPRAELVINTEIVKRAELVVHKGTPKLKRQTAP
jgi:hypothetical protein